MVNSLVSFFLRFRPVRDAVSNSAKQRRASPEDSEEIRGQADDLSVEYLSLSNEKMTALRVSQILQAAEQGSPQEQASLIQMLYDKEPIILAHMQTRIMGVLGCDWKIESVEEGKDSDKKQKALTANLAKAKIYDLMRHLLDAIGTGYAGSTIIWNSNGSIEKFVHVNPSNWLFDMGGNPGLWTTGGEKALSSFHKNQFVFHKHVTRPGIPSRGGLLRSLVWLWLFKHNAWRDRARFIEKFGIPFLVAHISQADFNNSSQKAAILNSLRKIGADGVAAVTEGSKIDTVNPPGQSQNADFHQFCKDIDDVYAFLILGQTGTSGGTPGKLGNETAQENVRTDILESDCRNLMETINTQVLNPLELFTVGTEEQFKFCLEYEPEVDLQNKANIVKTLKDSGFTPKRDWIEKTFDIPMEETPAPPPAPQPPPNFAKPAVQEMSDLSLSDGSARFASREEFISRLTENTLGRVFKSSEAMAEFYRPLQAEIRKVFKDIDADDPEVEKKFSDASKKLFEKYPAIYEMMDSAGFEDAMRGSMLAALVRGNSFFA